MVWKEGADTEDKPLPALFSDPVFLRSSNWVLSTSAVFSKHFPVYGWGEVSYVSGCFIQTLIYRDYLQVVPEGFGVAYMTGYDGKQTPS